MTRSFWLSVLAYLLPTFMLGYLWHLVLFADRYARLELYRADVIIPFGLTSMLIQALTFAWAYPRLFRTDDWAAGALRFFAVFGLLSWSFTTLPVAAKFRMTSVTGFMLIETAFTAVQFALVSPLVALAWRGVAPAASRRSLPLPD
jgi:riboflavin transporter FmnP